MHIVKIKQYKRLSAMKAKSSSHPHHQLWFLFPETTAITSLLHILPEIFYTYTNKHTILFRMICAHLHIYTHICIYPSKQNSNAPFYKSSFAVCFPLLTVLLVFYCPKEAITKDRSAYITFTYKSGKELLSF